MKYVPPKVYNGLCISFHSMLVLLLFSQAFELFGMVGFFHLVVLYTTSKIEVEVELCK